jgi:hypothetical protein
MVDSGGDVKPVVERGGIFRLKIRWLSCGFITIEGFRGQRDSGLFRGCEGERKQARPSRAAPSVALPGPDLRLPVPISLLPYVHVTATLSLQFLWYYAKHVDLVRDLPLHI